MTLAPMLQTHPNPLQKRASNSDARNNQANLIPGKRQLFFCKPQCQVKWNENEKKDRGLSKSIADHFRTSSGLTFIHRWWKYQNAGLSARQRKRAAIPT